MAFSSSGLYYVTWKGMMDSPGSPSIDLNLDTYYWALLTDTYSPDYSVHDMYADLSGEVANGNGYTTGGKVITGLNPAITDSPTGTLKYDQDDIAWTSASFTARGSVYYAQPNANDELIIGIAFGQDYTATNGTFTIQWPSGGIFTLDFTP